MMKMKKMIRMSWVLGGLVLAVGCQDHLWDDHYGLNPSTETRNLIQVLEGMPEYSAFCDVVKRHGMDSVLVTDQTFTMWVPDNNAMAGFVEDANTQAQFLENHIARYLYGTVDLADTSAVRVKMLNGKSHTVTIRPHNPVSPHADAELSNLRIRLRRIAM